MIVPATILRVFELSKTNDPKNVAVAPKLIKTIENPTVKRTIGNKFILFFSSSSLRVEPDIYEMYPGISGNTQGDKKLIKPALNARKISIIILYF